MKGFEPPTCGLQISCSGQLSYIGNLKNVPTGHYIPSKIGLQMYEIKFHLSKLSIFFLNRLVLCPSLLLIILGNLLLKGINSQVGSLLKCFTLLSGK